MAILAYGTFYSAIRANFDKKEREAMGAPRFKDGNETFAQAAGFQERARRIERYASSSFSTRPMLDFVLN